MVIGRPCLWSCPSRHAAQLFIAGCCGSAWAWRTDCVPTWGSPVVVLLTELSYAYRKVYINIHFGECSHAEILHVTCPQIKKQSVPHPPEPPHPVPPSSLYPHPLKGSHPPDLSQLRLGPPVLYFIDMESCSAYPRVSFILRYFTSMRLIRITTYGCILSILVVVQHPIG